MTTPCVSPSIFHGLPWESWTNSLGRTTPMEDKPPEVKKEEKNKAGVMKLPKEDMKIFGLCPERDIFTVVVCEACNMCVKPQALLHHFEMRHLNKDVAPAQPAVEVTLTEKTATKVMKAVVKNPPTKVKTKKTPNKESSKNKEGVVNPTPSLPVSLTLEAPMPDQVSSKGDTLQPVVALTPLSGTGAPVSPAAPVLSKPPAPAPAATPPVLSKARRPPRKHAPIKEREYDPDKHCGVVSTETMKPCTWSLTCKSHPMSLRRAVTGRSKPFDQLLTDHRQAKEALLKQKKNLELQNSSIMLTPPSSSQSSVEVKMSPAPVPPPVTPATPATHQQMPAVSTQRTVEPVATILFRLPELSLDVTPAKQLYLSASPTSLVVKGSERLAPPLGMALSASASTPVTTPATPTSATTATTASQLDLLTFTLNHPKALNASPMFSRHKIGGLVYTSRRMQIARQGLEHCLQRAGSGIYLAAAASGRGRELYSTLPPSAATLSTVLNSVTSRAAKRQRPDKTNKPNKKMCLTKEASSLLNMQINNLKSVLTRQYPNSTNNRPNTNNRDFHIPNILSNALKRSSDTPPKTQNKKLKKKNSQIMTSVLSNHTKNGIVPNKPGSYVRLAITNGKVETDTKTLGICETPKFTNSNKILSEADLRKLGLRFEIFE